MTEVIWNLTHILYMMQWTVAHAGVRNVINVDEMIHLYVENKPLRSD